MRSSRRRDLVRILRRGRAASQADLVAELRAAGHDVTQATISRDLQELGAIKIRANGGHVYRLRDEMPRQHGDFVARNLEHTLSEFALEVRLAQNLVVIFTAPGHAAAVARAIDLTLDNRVVGSVAGDDTIFVATPSERAASQLVKAWGLHAEEQE